MPHLARPQNCLWPLNLVCSTGFARARALLGWSFVAATCRVVPVYGMAHNFVLVFHDLIQSPLASRSHCSCLHHTAFPNHWILTPSVLAGTSASLASLFFANGKGKHYQLCNPAYMLLRCLLYLRRPLARGGCEVRLLLSRIGSNRLATYCRIRRPPLLRSPYHFGLVDKPVYNV